METMKQSCLLMKLTEFQKVYVITIYQVRISIYSEELIFQIFGWAKISFVILAKNAPHEQLKHLTISISKLDSISRTLSKS